MSKRIKAVMMAGGFGTRIQPLTHSIPKPMLPVVNLPMMEHTLNKLVETGIDEIVILLYYKPEVIKNHFGDGSNWGVKIHYVLPDDDYGTAGAVGFGREYLDTTFMIVSGDLVTDFDFKKIFDYHEKKNSKLTITLTSVENPLQFGVVIASEDGKIEKFLEKPSWGEVFSDTINTGIYIIEPEILDYIPVGENFDFAKDLFPLLMKEGIDLMGYNAVGYWRDVGNPDSYREVHDDILNERLVFKIPGRKVAYPDGTLYLTGESEIDESVEIIGNVVVGKNVKIGRGSKLNNVVIGDNVTLGEECQIRNSVFWHDIEIGKKFILDNGVICNNNRIDDNVTAKAGLILAEGCTIGKLAKIEQDVTIWPDKEIEPAAIVNRNVVWGSRYKNSIFEYGSVIGKSNVELSCEMATKLAEAYAAQLPSGTTIMVGRDHDKSSRMIKRAFLGGLLSAGINVIDLKSLPPSVVRYAIAQNQNIVGGAYVRRNLYDPTSTEINFYNEDGLRIDNNTAKSIEKAFFNEKFRRVEFTKIGTIHESLNWEECHDYRTAIELTIDQKILRSRNVRIAVDLMHGITADIFPKILSDIGLDNITLNAHPETRSMSSLQHVLNKTKKDLTTIVPSLGLDAGFAIFSGGQRVALVCDKGNFFDKIEGLSIVLYLLNLEAKSQNRKMKVFLPTWAPDMVAFEHLVIERGVYSNFKAEKLREYDLIATIDGNFAFTQFTLHRDAMFATLKIVEMLIRHDIKLSEIGKEIHPFFYKMDKIPCPQAKKGKMMRKFIEIAKGKKHSTVDGVKIWESDTDWILMIPDTYGDYLNLYLQARDNDAGEALYEKYTGLIKEWMNE
ncbi:sugar phosphate nucleotidyltransferase [Hydrogenimonas urashimensis]|uniref:sugar phosphate nucleotidyltransferase n=1 Tax=Hydrogenimonas urashimensis TaxID=2740515 RepID=UPI001916B03A|nr:sugar phosphate nucleotidyltransferase [Hydrogenimonas urashimensis]